MAGAGAREGELASDIARVVERFLAERRAGRQA
jgi:hypothetical protein